MNGQRRAGIKRTGFARKPPAAEPRHAAPGGRLARRTRLKYRSAKTAKVYRDERGPLVAALLAAHPSCQIRWDGGCQGAAVDVHEVLSRGRGGSITDEANCRTTCRYCHDQVGAHPAEAEARRFLAPSGRPAKAVPRHAAATP